MKWRWHGRAKGIAGGVCASRLALGCLFLYSSLPKIRQPYDFLHDVYSYELVGPRLGLLVAMTLPWLELLTGICLVGGIFVGGALLASAAMAAMFTFALAWALYHGLEISCGCFSSSGEKISYLTLLRAAGILLASIAAYAATIWLGPPASRATHSTRRPRRILIPSRHAPPPRRAAAAGGQRGFPPHRPDQGPV